jgi:hypothetical protein
MNEYFEELRMALGTLKYFSGLCNLYASPYITTLIKSWTVGWVGRVTRMGWIRNAYKVLVGKSEGKRPRGRPRRRLEDNIRTDLREIGWEGVDWSIWLRVGASGGLL